MDMSWVSGAADISAESQQTRKRPRSTSPMPPSSRRTVAPKIPDAGGGGMILRLKDTKQVDQALNELMQTTASHEINFTLSEDEPLLETLVEVVEYDKGERNHFESIEELQPARAWTLLKKKPAFPKTAIPRLHAVLMIFRNLSFVAANLRPMTQELSAMALLTDCLYLENHTDLLVHAVFTLVNLAPVLDITGQRLLADKIFVDTAKELHRLGWGGLQFAKQLDDTHQVSVDKEVLWEGTHKYVTQLWQIFSALHHIIVSPSTPRPVIVMALDWIKELLEHHAPSVDLPSMHDIFRQVPQDVMQRLVDFLWIPRLGPDALDYVNPITNIVSRVSTLKLFMGYDATVDTDLRDRALEVLQQLLEMGLTVPASPRLYNALLPCLSTKVGRNDAQALANGIFKALGKMADEEQHKEGLLYVQERILLLASQDARVAQVALGHLYRD